MPEKDPEITELSASPPASIDNSGMEIIRTSLATPETGDVDLHRRARSGDAESFAILYRQRADAIYRFALHMSGNPSIAEEVLQETFLALIRDSSGFDPDRGTLAAYVYGIARNRVRKHVAMGREFVEHDIDVAGIGDVLADMTRRETVESVRQAVLALPGLYREVVVLCELQELSYEDTAEAIGCPVGTVRSRLHRGRALLLTKLQSLKRNGALR
jgi:RNA polymerase sigma-70 factor (ECF subfamily)